MYCPSCGAALSQRMNYCNRCGAQTIATKESEAIESSEERLRGEMVDLFWLTVIGLGLIVGGMALMKFVGLGHELIIAYMALSSTAFLINFALSLWQIRRLARIASEARDPRRIEKLDTNELGPAGARGALEAPPSVAEHTTRRLEPSTRERIES